MPHRRFACKHLGTVGTTAVFTVEPDDGGTRLTRAMDFKVRIALLGKLLEELMVKAADPEAVRMVACPKLVDFFLTPHNAVEHRQAGRAHRSESAEGRASGPQP